MSHWLPAVVMFPLVAAALTPFLALSRAHVARAWALLVVALTSVGAVFLTSRLVIEGPFSYAMGDWSRPYGIELRFDGFSAAILFVCLIHLLVGVYSSHYAARVISATRLPWYYTLLLLNFGGMIGFAVTGDLFNLFIFMELVSVSSYALVAIGGGRVAPLAAFRYLLAGASSSVLILFCIGVIYALTGSLNMADVSLRLGETQAPAPIALALGGLAAGFMVKAALFPLHAWLPDAHASAPSPVSAVLSGVVVKLGILGLLRVYQVFHDAGGAQVAALNEVLVWLGAASILAGAFFALFQDEIKLILAYSTISNIGYIVLGLGLASQQSITGATIHVLNHALIKATLFLAAGALIHQTGCRTLHELRGAGHAMPFTSFALAVGLLAVIGVPPLAGFPGKWYVALGALSAGRPAFAVLVVLSAVLVSAYSARILNALYFQPPSHERILATHEAPTSMLLPVLILAALCLVAGVLARFPAALVGPAVARLIAPAAG
jgi:multicomponent Na+:H+ antiporter subunit D